MEKGDNSLIIILTTSLLHEIHIAKSLLASYGITSYVIDENIDLVYGRSVFEGFKLKVNISEKEKANEILKELKFSYFFTLVIRIMICDLSNLFLLIYIKY